MPPIWRDQTQIREENHIDVIFLSAADSYIFLLVADIHPPNLKSAQCRFESDWGHRIGAGRRVLYAAGSARGPRSPRRRPGGWRRTGGEVAALANFPLGRGLLIEEADACLADLGEVGDRAGLAS
jgi:hypothetical protein